MISKYRSVSKALSSLTVIVLLTGCGGSDELSRGQAHELLNDSDEVVTWSQSVHLTKKGRQIALDLDLVSTDGKLTKAGDEIMTGDRWNTRNWSSEVQPTIEVTAIGPSGQTETRKRIEFTLSTDALPSYAKAISIEGARGTAIAELWDDGWRIAAVDIQDTNSEFVLNDKDSAAIEARKTIVLDERRQIVESTRSAIKGCNSPTGLTSVDGVVLSNGYHPQGSGYYLSRQVVDFSVGDNGLLTKTTNRESPGSGDLEHYVDFGSLYGIRNIGSYGRVIGGVSKKERALGASFTVLLARPHTWLKVSDEAAGEEILSKIVVAVEAWRERCDPVFAKAKFVRGQMRSWTGISSEEF